MVEDTLKALELGAVEDLIIWDNLETNRYVLRNSQSGEETVTYMAKEQEGNENLFHDEGGAGLEVIENEPLVEWMANNYNKFGCNLEFVTDQSGEGTQFVKGFGGILRWAVDFVELNNFEEAAVQDHKGDHDDEEEDSDGSDEYGFNDGDYGF
jgi:peptide chain release factor subunit 1